MRDLPQAAAIALTAAMLTTATVSPATAFGDRCYRDVKATGSVQSSMSRARGAAIAAWEQAVSAQYGARFTNWYYSADRTFDCRWTDPSRIRCVAIAGPCARKR